MECAPFLVVAEFQSLPRDVCSPASLGNMDTTPHFLQSVQGCPAPQAPSFIIGVLINSVSAVINHWASGHFYTLKIINGPKELFTCGCYLSIFTVLENKTVKI